MEKSRKTVCSKFIAQQWDASKCRECFRKKQDHENESAPTSDDSQVPINTRPSSLRHPSSNDTQTNNDHLPITTFREQAAPRDTSPEFTGHDKRASASYNTIECDDEEPLERVYREESRTLEKNEPASRDARSKFIDYEERARASDNRIELNYEEPLNRVYDEDSPMSVKKDKYHVHTELHGVTTRETCAEFMDYKRPTNVLFDDVECHYEGPSNRVYDENSPMSVKKEPVAKDTHPELIEYERRPGASYDRIEGGYEQPSDRMYGEEWPVPVKKEPATRDTSSKSIEYEGRPRASCFDDSGDYEEPSDRMYGEEWPVPVKKEPATKDTHPELIEYERRTGASYDRIEGDYEEPFEGMRQEESRMQIQNEADERKLAEIQGP